MSDQVEEHYWGKRQIKHTPGPWHWDSDPIKDDPASRVRFRVCAKGRTITQCYYSSGDGFAEADARLISVAPDLLEACHLYRAFVEVMNDGPDDSDRAMAEGFLQRAHALSKVALAKADGAAAEPELASTERPEGTPNPLTGKGKGKEGR